MRADYPGPDADWARIVLGVRADAAQASVDVHSVGAVLIGGPTGSGKSVLQRNFLLHCLTHNKVWDVVAIDLMKVELSWVRRYDNTRVAVTIEEAVAALRDVSSEMAARYAQMEEVGATSAYDIQASPKATMVIVDEASIVFLPQGEKTAAGAEQDALRAEARTLAADLAVRGPQAGIHLVLCAQRISEGVVDDELLGAFDVRIMAGPSNPVPSQWMFGSDIAAELPRVRGRGVIATHGHAEPFQTYFAPQDWLDDQAE